MTAPEVAAPDLFLSHTLAADTPAYGGGASFAATAATRIATGSSANSDEWRFPSNHLGTHLDVPRHFFDGATTVDALPPSAWWFSRPVLVDVPLGEDGLVRPAHVQAALPADADFLLVRTGFESRRAERAYWEHNPGLTAELGEWCRRHRPQLRAVGMDFISVTARFHREEGRAAHRAFLDPKGTGDPLILIEDMALAHAPIRLRAACVAPLRVREGDGGPCTVLAWSAT